MKTILDKIVADRREAVNRLKAAKPMADLVAGIDLSRKANSLKQSLTKTGASGIIAEFKRRSPSKGIINDRVAPEIVTKSYARAGASGLSVLTEPLYFGGSDEDLLIVRKTNPTTPLLRKDFVIDEYQIAEAAWLKADAILLIAAVLSKKDIANLTSVAHDLGLEVLLELHDEIELEKIDSRVDLIGINNRNLKDFSVDTKRSLKFLSRLPVDKVKIAESGLSDPETVNHLRKGGFKGFLMGENFMKQEDPGKACSEFIQKLQII
jgi:indole-3-glycerol phosphate synthase